MSDKISLDDLVGPHVLTGVDTDSRESTHRMADSISFTLDGQTYLAVEDPDDGYRSTMDYIARVDEPILNQFATGVKILARMSPHNSENILELLNAETGKTILRVGTDNIDDYYPCWVAEYNPENL